MNIMTKNAKLTRVALLLLLFVAVRPAWSAIHWWENPEKVRSVALDRSAGETLGLACEADGKRLIVTTTAESVVTLYALPQLIRRNGGLVSLGTAAFNAVATPDRYLIGGRSLSYEVRMDGKVYVIDQGDGTELLDLSGVDSPVIQTQVACAAEGMPYLHVLFASGAVHIYPLAADGLSLALAEPVAAVDLSTFQDVGKPSCMAVSPDGLALLILTVTDEEDLLHVIRSANWGLVDCVSHTVLFPWRSDATQTSKHNVAAIGQAITIPDPAACWADPAIYKKVTWSTAVPMTSTFSNLTPGEAYQAEFHAIENYYGQTGKRVFDVLVNGTVMHDDLDIFDEYGLRAAFAERYDTTATGAGQITFSFERVVENPLYSGLAVWGREVPSRLTFTTAFAADGLTGTLAWDAKDALAYHVQSAPSSEGPWTTILLDQTAKTMTVSPGAAETYYRVVASNGVGTVASAARHNRRGQYTVYAINCGFDINRYGRFAPDDHLAPGFFPVRDHNLLTAKPGVSPDNADSVPDAIARTGTFMHNKRPVEYRFRNLNPERTYDVRIYCQETYFTAGGKRVASVQINGGEVLAEMDAFAQTGERFVLTEFVCPDASPDADGVLTLTFIPHQDQVDLSGIEIVENASSRVPLVPVVHGAFARNNGVHIAIGSGTGELTYDIRRRLAAGGEYETCATGLSDYGWIDTGVTAGYVYSVRAVDADGTAGAWSGDVAITPAGEGPQTFVGISPQRNVSFSNENGVYVPYPLYLREDMGLNEASQGYSHEIVLDPAPAQLYSRIVWWGSAEFIFTNLYPSASYRLRLQAIESYYTATGRRVTSGVYANNAQIYGAFDAYREVGKGVFPIEAVVKASPNGRINFFTTQQKDNIDFATVELFLLDGSSGHGASMAVRSGTADKPVWSQIAVPALDLTGVPDGVPATGNTFIWDTMLTVPADGEYTFDVAQGGEYALWLDDGVVGEARNGASMSATLRLAMGDHHLRARYAQGNGAAAVALTWTGPGFARQTIAPEALSASRTADLSQDDWLTAEIGTAHTGDFYKIDQQAEDGSEIWRMTSSSLGFFGRNDRSHFIYRAIKSPAFEARVRLRNIPDRSRDSTFGLTLRTELTPFGGDYVWQMISGVTTPGANTRWHTGPQGADFSVENPFINNNVDWDLKLPIWQRVRKWRDADGKNYAEFAYSLDVDAASWKVCCTNELTSTRPILVGVEACSYTEARLVSFEFDHFELDIPPPEGTVLLVR